MVDATWFMFNEITLKRDELIEKLALKTVPSVIIINQCLPLKGSRAINCKQLEKDNHTKPFGLLVRDSSVFCIS